MNIVSACQGESFSAFRQSSNPSLTDDTHVGTLDKTGRCPQVGDQDIARPSVSKPSQMEDYRAFSSPPFLTSDARAAVDGRDISEGVMENTGVAVSSCNMTASSDSISPNYDTTFPNGGNHWNAHNLSYPNTHLSPFQGDLLFSLQDNEFFNPQDDFDSLRAE